MTRPSILVTGCSSGIGRDAALTLAARGWQVVAATRQDKDRDALAAEGLATTRIDYEDPDSIARGTAETLEITGGRLDALYNNGAYAIPGALEDLPVAGLRAIFDANLIGWHDLTRRIIPVMRRQGHGRILMCSSVLGIVATPWRGAYVATKFALEGYTDALRQELSDTPIRVVLIQPGPIGTPFRQNSAKQFEQWIDWQASPRAAQYRDTLLKRLYAPEAPLQAPPAAVTRQILRALEARNPRNRYRITPHTSAMEAARRLLPSGLLDRILRRA
ncbi:MAG: SDR family NAD(P)-dependent oxidoreductase [Qingshengfaniella sp.]